MIANYVQKKQIQKSIVIRTDGLLGDNIVASTAFRNIISSNHDSQIVIINTYNHDPRRLALLNDLYYYLLHAGIIRTILHYPRAHGPLTTYEKSYLYSAGARAIYDCGPFEEEFKKLHKEKPFLGIVPKQIEEGNNILVALFRYSRFHNHYPLRNRPIEEWYKIEEMVISLGAKAVLFGVDDDMSKNPSTIDFRGSLSVNEVLAYVHSCRCIISTTTFLPLYAQHYIPCFVLSDPDDIDNLIFKWRVLKNYSILNVTKNYFKVLNTLLPDLIS